MRPLHPLLCSTAIATHLLLSAPVSANCADSVGSLAYFQPAMERWWQQLQAETDYPWGKARPYGELEGNRILLTPAFDDLTGQQKQQVLDVLFSGYGEENLYSLLTPAEREQPGAGALSPYRVFTHDGKLVYAAYDGCTPVRMLTERERYRYYYTRLPNDPNTNRTASIEDLRNAGTPFWRNVQFSISATDERVLRQRFWETVGYDKANQNWWIAWVPETGHFEINVPEDYDPATLQRFWQVAPERYRYIVMSANGTTLKQR
jgi:hypothetical protein